MLMSPLKELFLAIFICFIFAFLASSENCDPNHLLALKEFAGNITNGSIIANWVDESTCCEWDGVECDLSSPGRVIMLKLSNMSLRGVISRSLGNLDQLTLIDLSYNHLQGVLPKQISNLKMLKFLDLSHNSISGPLPKSLSELNSLISMNISGNSFNGDLIDLSGFTSLVELNISSNSFTGEFGSQICNFSKKIQVLDISTNEFSGNFQELKNCSKSLQQLRVDGNYLSGHIPEELYSLSSLEHLSLANSCLSGHLSNNLGKLSNLKTLVISVNQFSGPIPDVFRNLPRLETFLADSNLFSGKLPQTFSLCSNLRMLDLRNNSLSGPIDLNCNNLSKLFSLDLATNHFSGRLPDLSNCRKLEVVSFAKNSLIGEIPNSYRNLTSLVFLSLSNNTFVNLSRALSVLQNCPKLETLVLTKNFNGEQIPENVIGFKNLSLFALGNCKVTGKIPYWLRNCSNLQVLDLSWNHLDGEIPNWIGHLEKLFYLDLSNNSLIGEIPKSLTELKCLSNSRICSSNLIPPSGIPLFVKRNQTAHGLQYNKPSNFPPSIYLSNNRINGTIWPEIGNLKQLHVLDLSRNNISGTIPDSISGMGNLETLDLSSNELSGTIPWSLNKLTFLSKFSVANNHLKGHIPTGGQFSSFPRSSFEGNQLCGTIDTPCPNETKPNSKDTKSNSENSKNRLQKGSIFGIMIGAGAGISLLLAFILIRYSRRGNQDLIQDFDEEASRAHEGPSKLVLFRNSDCVDLTVTDLLKSTANFSQINIIGCGGFGLVYKANLPNGLKAAVKKLSGDCGQMEREFQAEVEALSRAQHKNLVSLQGYCLHGNDRLLIYSYMENGSLDYWLHERVDGGSVLKWDTRLKIAKGACHGLRYLHKEPNIIHRDIKTSNILLDEKFEPHLADFGLSRLLHPYDTHVTTDLVGTLGYIPPEYSQTLTATFKGDVYSFGVVIIELLTGRRPVEVCKGKNTRDLVSWVFQMKSEKREEEIFDSILAFNENEKQLIEVLGIACRCLDQDPRRRPFIDEVVTWLDAVGNDNMSVL